MGTTWVLDTETKGTGANMIPLERAAKRSAAPEHAFRLPAARPRDETPAPKAPRRFRIVDVMTHRTLLDDGGVREAITALAPVRSVVDVNTFVWDEERTRWLPLAYGDQRRLLELAHSRARGRACAPPPGGACAAGAGAHVRRPSSHGPRGKSCPS